MSDAVSKALAQKFKSVSANVIVTSELLAQQYGAMLDTEQLGKLLKLKPTSITQKISRGDFSIPVTRIGNKWYATAFDVSEYIERNKQMTGL